MEPVKPALQIACTIALQSSLAIKGLISLEEINSPTTFPFLT